MDTNNNDTSGETAFEKQKYKRNTQDCYYEQFLLKLYLKKILGIVHYLGILVIIPLIEVEKYQCCMII